MNDISLKTNTAIFNYRVGLLVTDNKNLLIEINNNLDFTIIPGGRPKIGENSVECLKREIKEELNYEINESMIYLRAIIEHIFTKNNKIYHVLHFVYKYKNSNKLLESIDYINHDQNGSYYKFIDIKKLHQNNLLPRCLETLALSNGFDHIIDNGL